MASVLRSITSEPDCLQKSQTVGTVTRRKTSDTLDSSQRVTRTDRPRRPHRAITNSDTLLQDGNDGVDSFFTNRQLTQQRTLAFRLRLWNLAP